MRDTRQLRDLRSIGPAMLRDFDALGVTSVQQLKRKTARELYEELCRITGQRQDPCVLDVFECAIAQAKDPKLPAEKCDSWWWSRRRKRGMARSTRRGNTAVRRPHIVSDSTAKVQA